MMVLGRHILKYLLLFSLLLTTAGLQAQDDSGRNWDNQIYLGNKVAFGKNKWKFSGELQTRLRNNMQTLDNWYLEGVSNYLATEWLEVVPDFRFTIKPDKLEWRPGFGLLYKNLKHRLQFINQVKWQLDINNHGATDPAFREVVFLNYKLNDKVILSSIAGFIYRWRSNWHGFQYIRVGPGISYIFDEKHILNFSYFTGVENVEGNWHWAGIPSIQLLINVSMKYRYKPAYYIEF
jgi:hypothetical protein